MCISTNDLKILDISNYLPPATSYEKYLKTYLGECKCEDKIKCLCGLGKGLFCYEYITSFDKLNETALPPKQAFDSKLKGTTISDDDYKRLEFVWSHYEMKTVKDLLIWYNNLDVEPFVDAVKKQREFYKTFDLDMLTDGVSLPSLAEKVMYQTCYDELNTTYEYDGLRDYIESIIQKISVQPKDKIWFFTKNKKLLTYAYIRVRYKSKHIKTVWIAFKSNAVAEYVGNKLVDEFNLVYRFVWYPCEFDPPFSFSQKRLDGYKQQDRKSCRKFGLTIKHLDDLLDEVGFRCEHCKCRIAENNVSADRIDNSIGHIDGNVMITCFQCNVARKDMNIRAFRRQKLLERKR
jgi:hypothetical protein